MSNIVKSIVKLMSASVFVQVLNLLFIPILARIYTVEDFGVFGIVSSGVLILATVCGFKYEQAILISNNQNDGYVSFLLSNLIAITINVISLLVIIFLYYIGFLEFFYIFIPILSCLTFLMESLTLYISLQSKYTFLSISRIAVSISNNVSKSFIGYFFSNGFGLIYGQFIGLITFFFIYLKNSFKKISPRVRKKDLTERLLRDKRFATIYLPQSILNVLTHNLPAIILSLKFDPIVIGKVWMIIRILQLPLGVIGDTFKNVFTPILNHHKNKNEVFIKVTFGMFFIAIAAIVITNSLSAYIFPLVLGNEWDGVDVYANYLIFYAVTGILISPAIAIVLINKSLKVQLYYELLQFVIIIFCVIISLVETNEMYFIKGASLARLLLGLFFVLFIYLTVKKYDKFKV